jgi:hypothetical protein
MPDFLIATGADAAYFPLVEELLASIRAAAPDHRIAFGVIDGGLTEAQRAWLIARRVIVADPSPPAAARRAVRKRPALKVNLAKPELDLLFPTHTTLLWLDADTWVQRWSAVEMMLGAAASGALAVVPDGGRFWTRQTEVRWLLGGWRGLAQLRTFNFKNAWNAGLPVAICRDIGTRALLNAGVFALRRDAPHWARMRHWRDRVLRRGKPFTSDQLAMALTVYVDELPLELLPETCNFISPHRVDPENVTLVESYYPYPPVGIVHLSAQKSMRFDPDVTTELLGLDGRTFHASLRFGLFQTGIERARLEARETVGA